jgi:hypothetical protein
MSLQHKNTFFILLLVAGVVFILFSWPNSIASKNLAMVQMFQPDEAATLPYAFHMIAPSGSINQALRSFVFYDYYYYGFPYFSISAIVLLPLQWSGIIANISLAMLILRQLVSLLPMLIALLLLIYMQDGFRSYRSVVLFIILLLVPAVVQNNLWWHPDGITFLFVVLTIFFLKRDNLRFGWNFLFAAAMTGVATATKLVGIYFFLAVGLTLILGMVLKKASWKKLIGMATVYLIVMGLVFLFANPFLLSHWARTAYGYILQKQTFLLSEGYGVVYEKGLSAVWPLMRQSYGGAIFLLISLGTAIWGAWRGPQRLLHGLILAWFLPITILILFITHFKFQYWLPVALPLFSTLTVIFPEKMALNKAAFMSTRTKAKVYLPRILILLVVLIQTGIFINQDIQILSESIHRADNNPRINFYNQTLNALSPIYAMHLYVYYDYRLYVPETNGWTSQTTFDLLNYSYIQENNFEIILLLEQRIRDYLNPNVTGIDPEAFSVNQQFYSDADHGTINGYHLIYRNDVGLVYVREDLYQNYFHK